MLDLSGVTLCCADTANPELALRALRISASRARFGRALLLTDRAIESPGLEVRSIATLASRAAYSQFVLKDLAAHIDTPHVLLIQWDGYVVHPDAWRDEFLACDYLGAKWSWHDSAQSVGNGGFSLRSQKLLAALQDPRIELSGPEDETICRAFRPLLEREHGIVFGTEALADAFAFEASYPLGRPFGFHGLFNFCRFMSDEEIAGLARAFSPEIARSPQLLQLGRNCAALGQWRAAEAVFRRILEVDSRHAEAAAQLSAAARNAGSSSKPGRNDPCPCGSGKRYKHCHGAAEHGEPLPAVPDGARKLLDAIALHERGELDTALSLYREVLADRPDSTVARHFVGVIHYQRGNLAEALPLLEHSVAQNASEPEYRNNLGLALFAADREAEAIAQYRAAIALKSDHAVAWNNLGIALQSQNETPAAIDAFRRALELKADFTRARWNLALALLLDGRFAEGWREYEVRLQLPELGGGSENLPGPTWQGEDLSEKTLLVQIEQGLGDTIQFVRYASSIAAAGARCVIRCPRALAPLLATIPGVAEVVLETDALPRYDFHVPLLSIAGILGTTQATIPSTVPYLSVDEGRRVAARKALAPAGHHFRVGLCWAGSPANSNDRNRSMALALFAPLFELPGIAWFSLQAGDAARQVAATAAAARVIPLPSGTQLVDTAALIAELDLIVTVDTGIAHLAGALAKPTWMLIPFAPDWRWQLGRQDSPWYPTLRIFRQPRLRDWASVVERVREELSASVRIEQRSLH
jgi:tetratricopeptide (TPR) repeat protein